MSRTIKLGSYNGKSISWSLIGDLNGHSLYLCDEILMHCEHWTGDFCTGYGLVHQCLRIYHECFSDEEQNRLVNHPELGDPVFLLNQKEYNKYREDISLVDDLWWIHSSSNYFHNAMYVGYSGAAIRNSSGYSSLGFRPAILLKNRAS